MNAKQKILWMVIGGGLVILLICGSCAPIFLIAGTMSGTEMSGTVQTGPAVGIVRVEGAIVSGRAPANPLASQSTAFSDEVINHLKQAEENSDVKAVVLRVSSPGGSVVASNEIYEQLQAMTKPVVVSMGEMAASGGYYISAPADEIYANPSTLTGSISVISQFINIGELLQEYGVEVTIIKSGKYKDLGSMFRPMTNEEKALWQEMTDEIYLEFVDVVAEGRDLPVEDVKDLADGRVFTGRQAKELGLVDELGNLPDAVNRAAELGGIEGDPRVVEFYEPLDVFQGLFGLAAQSTHPLSQVVTLLDRRSGPVFQLLYLAP